MKVLQNMKVKDIINRKVIKDELFLLKTNVKSLILSWRITRTPYFLSILLVYLSYISMPAARKIIGACNTIESVNRI